MRHLLNALAILFVCILGIGASCDVKPVNPTPTVIGGAPSTGGASVTGGVPQGGSVAAGGVTAEGGSSVGTTVAVEFPVCNQTQGPKSTVKRMLSGWKKSKDRAKHRRLTASYSVTSPSVFHAPNVANALDQGSLGSCTGNAVAHCLSTWPFEGRLTESDAVAIYKTSTTIDPFPWTYPPTDSGSNGSSAARAAKLLGLTTLDFGAVDTVEGLAAALQNSACIIGVDWHDGFNYPTKCGEMQQVGAIQGGHEGAVTGWDAKRKTFWFRNSWGPTFGNRRVAGDNGYAYWTAGTVQRLLAAGAEIDCPILPPANDNAIRAAVGF